ncbi:MAG: hypothetical protein WCI84_09950 [Bacteroidota bacterium]
MANEISGIVAVSFAILGILCRQARNLVWSPLYKTETIDTLAARYDGSV